MSGRFILSILYVVVLSENLQPLSRLVSSLWIRAYFWWGLIYGADNMSERQNQWNTLMTRRLFCHIITPTELSDLAFPQKSPTVKSALPHLRVWPPPVPPHHRGYSVNQTEADFQYLLFPYPSHMCCFGLSSPRVVTRTWDKLKS